MAEERNESEARGPENSGEANEPIINDKRRIDPETGEVRDLGKAAGAESAESTTDSADPAAGQAAEAAAEGLSVEDLEKLLSGEGAEDAPTEGAPGESDLAQERLQDLQRVQAEYANYRRRTDREKSEAYDATKAEVLRSLLPVLDDLDRAQKHGDLVEDTPMAVIANKLRSAVERLGLTAYGEAGEAFDPQRYEAIAQLPNPSVTTDTVADVVERGYTVGDRVVRVAKAAVFVPAS